MYNVAFIYTEKAGGYYGIVTWWSWPTKEAFQEDFAKWSEDMKQKKSVLEEDISESRCLYLVSQVPRSAYARAAMEKVKTIFA